MLHLIKNIIEKESIAISNLPVDESYQQAIDLIFEAVHINHGKLITSGMGKAGQIAINIATTFSSTGTPAVFLHPSEAQHGDLGIMQNNDILLLVSNSGKTREIVELVTLADRLYSNLKKIVITGNSFSDLGKNANVVLYTGKPQEVCPLGLTPTTSMTVMNVIGDILTVMMMNKINFSIEDYAKRHHGGYLGEKSKAQLQK